MQDRTKKRSPGRKWTRRDLLHAVGGALAVPYLVPSGVLGCAGQPAPSSRITTALIGAGSRGQQIIAGGDRVVAVCDVDAKRRAQAKRQIDTAAGDESCREYGDFREVLDRADVDAVVIATPDHWHVPMAMAAIRAGKAVYVEKPLSLTVEEGRRLADLVRRYGGILQVGSQQRSDEKFIRACELVRNGRLGRVHTIRVTIVGRPGPASGPWTPQPVPPELDYEMWLGPAPWTPYHKDRCHYNFRFVSDYSGGDMTNWGAHHMDIVQWALDADQSGPIQVTARGQRHPTGLHDTFFDVEAEYLYPGDVKVILRSQAKDIRTGGVRFEGTEGWVYVSRETIQAEPQSLLSSPIGPGEIHLGPEGGPSTHMGIWLDCIRRRNPKGLNAPAEVGHRSATVCHLANIAMELGRPLRWDPTSEQCVDDPEANRLLRRTPRAPWAI